MENLDIKIESIPHRIIKEHPQLRLLIIFLILTRHQLSASTNLTSNSISSIEDDKENFLLIKIKSTMPEQTNQNTIHSADNSNINDSRNHVYLHLNCLHFSQHNIILVLNSII